MNYVDLAGAQRAIVDRIVDKKTTVGDVGYLVTAYERLVLLEKLVAKS